MSEGSTDSKDANEGEESVDETLDQLARTVEETADEDGSDTDGGETDRESDSENLLPDGEIDIPDTDIDTLDGDIDTIITRAVEDIESLLAGFEGDASLEGAAEDIEDLIEVAEEAGELLGSVDPAALAGAVDLSQLPEAIELDDVPEAAAEADPGEAIKYRKLIQVVELGDLWDGMDVRDLWENKREFADELDDITAGGSSSDDGPLATLREVLDWLTGDDEGMVGDEDGLFGDDTADSESETTGPDATAKGRDHEDIDIPSEAIQQQAQSGLDDAVAEFREGLIEVRERIARMKAENEQRIENVEQPTSRNPTAYSTLSTAGGNTPGVAKFSTVPPETKYSNAPNRERLYGSRLERATEADDE